MGKTRRSAQPVDGPPGVHGDCWLRRTMMTHIERIECIGDGLCPGVCVVLHGTTGNMAACALGYVAPEVVTAM